ncbi:MAG TPA: hypothetical protein VFO29_02295 [Candidatus Rubrimentiphilum sp.]|nr:hypothetical protein [Candidatus Rubrimentiphilum sp.]
MKASSPITRHYRSVGLGLAVALVIALPANADQRYAVTGNDRYRIGSADLQTHISYIGTQQLTVRRAGSRTQFKADAKYVRVDESGSVPVHATFAQIMTPQGELQDLSNGDPDYLTVLNQPFAIELDQQTLRDLTRLNGRVPFEFPAPVMGGTLHGYLQRGGNSLVAAQPALAVNFDATGPMSGPLPDRTAMTMRGTMRMRGTAYYALQGAPILLALQETLTISGTLQTGGRRSPVTITYERSIKAEPLPSSTEADSH